MIEAKKCVSASQHNFIFTFFMENPDEPYKRMYLKAI